ncbi:MAG: hypothetical protein B6I30_06605 [Desulfobacteraceae bacterium 4572_187]|nr:MAG: hypothetical protein B6I30_06605 [Desulfobacteraceae bacterium 4572_187]
MNAMGFYNTECLPTYRERDYAKTRELLFRFFNDYDPDAMQKIRARLAMGTSLIACMYKRGSPDIYIPEFIENLERYFSELEEVDITTLAPEPFLDYFGLTINFSLIKDAPEDIQASVSESFNRFVLATAPKMKKEEYLAIWVREIDKERRNFGSPDHIERTIKLAKALLLEIDGNEDMKAYRIAVNRILADVVYFYHSEGTKESDRAREAITYLESVLVDSPKDLHAESFKKDINKFSETSLQIHRFHHDSNTRLGSMHVLIEKIINKCPGDAPYYSDILGLNRQLSALRAITMLAKDKQPATDDWQKIDPAEIIFPLIHERKWPKHCVIRDGEPSEWTVWPEYTALVFENLLKNTVEAYHRRLMDIPGIPCEIRIFYNDGKIEYRDFAGGINLAGDIFEPYRSSKGVVSDTGLGLTQAKKAMELQNYRIILANRQPENGALFIIDFNKKKQRIK